MCLGVHRGDYNKCTCKVVLKELQYYAGLILQVVKHLGNSRTLTYDGMMIYVYKLNYID